MRGGKRRLDACVWINDFNRGTPFGGSRDLCVDCITATPFFRVAYFVYSFCLSECCSSVSMGPAATESTAHRTVSPCARVRPDCKEPLPAKEEVSSCCIEDVRFIQLWAGWFGVFFVQACRGIRRCSSALLTVVGCALEHRRIRT